MESYLLLRYYCNSITTKPR